MDAKGWSRKEEQRKDEQMKMDPKVKKAGNERMMPESRK